MNTDLDAMRAENIAAWSRPTSLPDYERVVVHSCSRYLPELEAELERLRAENERLSAEATFWATR